MINSPDEEEVLSESSHEEVLEDDSAGEEELSSEGENEEDVLSKLRDQEEASSQSSHEVLDDSAGEEELSSESDDEEAALSKSHHEEDKPEEISYHTLSVEYIENLQEIIITKDDELTIKEEVDELLSSPVELKEDSPEEDSKSDEQEEEQTDGKFYLVLLNMRKKILNMFYRLHQGDSVETLKRLDKKAEDLLMLYSIDKLFYWNFFD